VAAVETRERERGAAALGEDEVEDVHVAPGCDEAAQRGEDAAGVGVVDVVEEAVHEHEVELPLEPGEAAGDVRGDEFLPEPPACVLDVARIQVDADVLRVQEVRGVGPRAACDVEHAADAAEIVVPLHRRQLGVGEPALPEPVDGRVLEEPGAQRHAGRHSAIASELPV
jgi:hypothetical protein